MKAIASPAPERRRLAFRPGSGPIVFAALVVTMAVYFPLRAVPALEAPFAIAAIIGLVVYACLRLARRRDAIVVSPGHLADTFRRIAIAWPEVDTLRIEVIPGRPGSKAPALRVASVIASDGRIITFGHLAGHTPAAHGRVVDLKDAALLLAIIADRTGGENLFPESWRAGQLPGEGQPGSGSAPGTIPPPLPLSQRMARAWGLIPLLFKLLKSIKPLSALFTFGVYSLVFSWKFALAMLIVIGFHECGHVFAMYRCGVPVRGIYFIPFFGGAAVGSLARTRRDEAYIAANGPVWGTLLAFACFAAYALTGDRFPQLAAAGAWGALVNLFNLLPIMPLDGGRLLGGIAYSLGPGAGAAAVAGSLLLGGGVAYWFGYDLLVIMVGIGLLEFLQGSASSRLAAARAWLSHRPFAWGEFDHFAALVSPVTEGARNPRRRQAEADAFGHRLHLASLQPMTRRQTAFILILYLALAAILMIALAATSDLPGHGDPIDLLR
jgi:Zn-dependent protease